MIYIYKITNNVNNKIYIGQSKYNDPKYLGSGNYIRKAVKKYGIKNFTKEIIEECSDIAQANEREKYWIKKLDSKNLKIGYNIADGGSSFIMNDSIKKKIKISLSGKYTGDNSFRKGVPQNIETRKKISEGNKGRIKNDDTRKKMSSSAIGKKLSEDTKKKLSNSHKGKILSDSHKEKISNGLIGRILTNDIKEKIRKSNIDKTQKRSLCFVAENIITKEILHFNSCSSAARKFCTYRKKIKDNLIDGWIFTIVYK